MANLNVKSILNNNNLVVTRLAATTVITLIIIVSLPSYFVEDALAESPHFVAEPHIISKTLSGKTGTLTLKLTLNFTAVGLGNKPLTAYLTTTGGTPDNTVCINNGGNVPAEPKAVFGPTKGQTVNIQPQNGEITFSNMPLSITVTADQANCPDNLPPFITRATLQNLELHLVQNVHGDSFEVLTFNFRDESLPTAYNEATPHA